MHDSDRVRRSKALAVIIFLLGAQAASANGAMGLGLEMWDLSYWYAYVVATVVFEAWYIGRWLKYGWIKSLFLSALANFITGMCCGAGGICAPFLHEFPIGHGNPPQPFLHGLGLLAFYAIPSSFFEYLFVWNMANQKAIFGALTEASFRDKLFIRSLKAHLLGIPLALAILLIPAHPYRGFSSRAYNWKVLESVSSNIAAELSRNPTRFPNIGDRQIQARLLGSPDYRLAFLRPELTRFRAVYPDSPLEWNTKLSGRKMSDYFDQAVWIVRSPDHFQPMGIVLEVYEEDKNRVYIKPHTSRQFEDLGLPSPEQH